jgi:hypothetical protein
MPTRILRDWTDSYRFDGISSDAEVLFIRLIMKADDYGCFHGDARIVESICYPLGVKSNISKSLAELEKRGLIAFYSNSGRDYLTITNFGQRLRHTTRKFPDPDDASSAAIRRNLPQSAAICGQVRLEVEVEVEGNRNEVETKSSPRGDADGFEEFWKAYPRKVGKGAALASWRKAKPPLDAVLTAIRKARQSPDWLKDRGAFIPHPSTWLNQSRWEDEGMDYAALAGKRDSGAIRGQEIDESDAFRWRCEQYPESLEVHPTAATFPFRAWPDSIKAEYRNRNKQPVAA